MNRIVIIGNGFDLAHGLKTRYEDFFNWYWDKWLYKLKISHTHNVTDGLCSFTLTSGSSWHSFLLTNMSLKNFPKGAEIIDWMRGYGGHIKIELSRLIYQINQSIQEKTWVDIENEYYKLLKVSLNKSNNLQITPTIVNDQFKILEKLLIEYLNTIDIDSIQPIPELKEFIYEPIDQKDISIKFSDYYRNFCLTLANSDINDVASIIEKYELKETFLLSKFENFKSDNTQKGANGGLTITKTEGLPASLIRPQDIMLLSFNYTPLIEKYVKLRLGQLVNIHGKLSIPESVIFGYGDELDCDYNNLLNNDNNEYLRNVKTVRYLESDNYNKILQFINSGPFQVYVMGHSCGNSDRTLLNTLFEHRNCVGIKPFYFQRQDGSDNYIEIVQNIYRNFTDMKLMRERVVNKTYCEPLPQSRSYVEEVE